MSRRPVRPGAIYIVSVVISEDTQYAKGAARGVFPVYEKDEIAKLTDEEIRRVHKALVDATHRMASEFNFRQTKVAPPIPEKVTT